MSFFNPFHELHETNTYPKARTYRTTFGQKTWDTFKVFSGNLSWYEEYDKKKSKIQYPLHFGIFDYLTLGIPYLLTLIPLIVMHFVNSTAAKIVCAAIALTLCLPRFVFAGVLTLVSLPFIAIAQATSSSKGDKYKDRINNFTIPIANKDEVSSTHSIAALLWVKGMELESIKDSTIDTDKSNARIKNITLKDSKKKSISFQLTLGSQKERKVYNALRKLNIGYLQSGIELEERNAASVARP